VAVALGSVLLILGFALGTQPTSTSVGNKSYACDSAIPITWLASGTPSETSGPDPAETPRQREVRQRVLAQCQGVVLRTRWLTWGSIGLGGLAVLVGWTALREREHDRLVSQRHAALAGR
jgi:hypothetical protein